MFLTKDGSWRARDPVIDDTQYGRVLSELLTEKSEVK